ncbi:hypothetical protein REPUB_Repub07fG0112400 [Reevesia pubescens]
MIQEILPVIKYEELVVEGNPLESCAVCLYEFEGGEEIRWLRNCRHVFHRACLDRWMDHDQKMCPLCRTPFVPDELHRMLNEKLKNLGWWTMHVTNGCSAWKRDSSSFGIFLSFSLLLLFLLLLALF